MTTKTSPKITSRPWYLTVSDSTGDVLLSFGDAMDVLLAGGCDYVNRLDNGSGFIGYHARIPLEWERQAYRLGGAFLGVAMDGRIFQVAVHVPLTKKALRQSHS